MGTSAATGTYPLDVPNESYAYYEKIIPTRPVKRRAGLNKRKNARK